MSFVTDRPQLQGPAGTGCGGLQVRWQPDGTMWIGTFMGDYICTSNDPAFVLGLIMAERQAKPDPVGRPYLHLGAKEIVDPGQGERREALEIAKRTKQHAAFSTSREPKVKLSPLSGTDLLKELGL